ncbi:hypothetical protein [Cellulomonas sp.]|uniref:hypothetical protein n=1 Tax=Cellulomonas sp. TaxID=40001 RepID=UPI0028119F46|nr:hypothetical protein [Cellulomonas sp.]
MRVASVLVLPVLVLALVLVAARRVRVEDRDVAWLAGGRLPDPAVADVYRRYLHRHRAHRTVGGWFGVLLAVTYGLTAQDAIRLGTTPGSPLGDVLLCGLAGVVAGALSAEVYRSALPPGPVVASLAPHPRPRGGGAVRAARLLAAGGLVVGVVAAVTGGVGPALGGAAAGAVLVGTAEVARAAVVDRRRPLLSPVAAQVDDRIRAFASGALARLELAAGAVGLAWALSGAAAEARQTAVTAVLAVVVPVLLVLAVVQLYRARPRPPHTFVPAAPVGAAAA